MAERVSQTPTTTANSAPRKPRFALAIATAFGLGYLPLAPGTWGSLAAIPIYYLLYAFFFSLHLFVFTPARSTDYFVFGTRIVPVSHFFAYAAAAAVSLMLALIGVRASSRVAEFSGKKDPQFVVIDEVSGQHLTYLLASLLPVRAVCFETVSRADLFGLTEPHSVLNWKFLLAGFILFRVFDIWKPFPARQAESLPGGWGIMADDWVAAVYAALGLWLLRALGL
jgi:phosphatidylglycerophosphatase A